eukprot:GHVS01051526.1.p1 GENE.GHVS01051526.1~~GHVS01051526.1.p1  ORF type:complete len:525 (-),score=91.02 GHVS01051526.1:259-1833(-)
MAKNDLKFIMSSCAVLCCVFLLFLLPVWCDPSSPVRALPSSASVSPLSSLHNFFFPSPSSVPPPPHPLAYRPPNSDAVHWVLFLIGFPVVPGSTDVRHIQKKLLAGVPHIQFFKVNYPKYIAGRGIDVAAQYALVFVEKYILPFFRPGDQLSFIGHSFGGLVGRDLIFRLKQGHPTIWGSLVKSNFVSLGAPHSGQAAAAEDMMYVLAGTPVLYMMGTERYAKQISSGDDYLASLASPEKVNVMKEFANVMLYGVPGSLRNKKTGERASTDSIAGSSVQPKLEWLLRKDWMGNVGNELMLPQSFRMVDAQWLGELPQEGEEELLVEELVWPTQRRLQGVEETGGEGDEVDDDPSNQELTGYGIANELVRSSFPVDLSNPLAGSVVPCSTEALVEEFQSASFLFTNWLLTYSLSRDLLSLINFTPIAIERSYRYYETLDKLSEQMNGGNIHRYGLFVPDWVYKIPKTNMLDLFGVAFGRGHLALAAMTAEEAAARTAWCGSLASGQLVLQLVDPVANHVMDHFVV